MRDLIDAFINGSLAGRQSVQVTLGELIGSLEDLPSDLEVEKGIESPHSYRGYYTDLAFEPTGESTVGEMLKVAKSALHETFTGYKGGEYTMDEDAVIWVSREGSTGNPVVKVDDITGELILGKEG